MNHPNENVEVVKPLLTLEKVFQLNTVICLESSCNAIKYSRHASQSCTKDAVPTAISKNIFHGMQEYIME